MALRQINKKKKRKKDRTDLIREKNADCDQYLQVKIAVACGWNDFINDKEWKGKIFKIEAK